MPNYKPAADQPYDSRITKQDDETFTFTDPESKNMAPMTVPKNQGLLTGLAQGVSMTDKQSQKANAIRKQMGWKVTIGDGGPND